MKNFYSLLSVLLFASFAVHADIVDYTRGLAIWFDTPNNLDGQAIWLRASGLGRNPDQSWESRSLPIIIGM